MILKLSCDAFGEKNQPEINEEFILRLQILEKAGRISSEAVAEIVEELRRNRES